MAAASGQPDRIPSIEAPPALYRQPASQVPSRRSSARIAEMNWTDPCYNLTPRRSERPFYFWLNGKEFLSRNLHLRADYARRQGGSTSGRPRLSVTSWIWPPCCSRRCLLL